MSTGVLDVPGLLRRLLADDPGRPRLTWYGPAAERVELSAKVLDNWVAKTANLLVDELDVGPGGRLVIALPAHWRTVTWLLATWSVGACVVLAGPVAGPRSALEPESESTGELELPPGDVLVAADARLLRRSGSTTAVAVALPALATSFGPDLPDGALDAAVEVRAHGDVFVPFVRPAAQDRAFEPAGPASTITHGELIASAARAADDDGLPERVRLLSDSGPDGALHRLLAPLLRLGSVVLHHDLSSLDPQALARLRSQEGITATGAGSHRPSHGS